MTCGAVCSVKIIRTAWCRTSCCRASSMTKKPACTTTATAITIRARSSISTQDPIGLMGGWNGYAYPLDPVSWIDSMGLAPNKYGHLKNGGYGARPTPPSKPNPSKLPGIAEKLMPKYSIDQASSEQNVFKTFFTAFSPYDYTPYCRKWVKPNLTCTQWDDPSYPGMDTKIASNYLPPTDWPADRLPAGYICAEPCLFPDLDAPRRTSNGRDR